MMLVANIHRAFTGLSCEKKKRMKRKEGREKHKAIAV